MPPIPTDEGLPRRLGRYVVVKHLASGGMGSVYLALQSTGVVGLERPCVVKTVRARLVESHTAYERFIDEARTSLLLHHKNLCTTFDVAEVDGTTVLAMEHILGRTLRQVFERIQLQPDILSAQDIVGIATEVLDGLEHAHYLTDPRTGQPLGLVHRDISPQNIMVSFDGDVKVIDFGVARSRMQTTRTAQGAVVGKVSYMAAEQIAGGAVDRRADVACLGIILVELLSGRRFYGDLSLSQIWAAWGQGESYHSDALDLLPPTLQVVLERAVAADPAERFGSAGALKEALVAALGAPRPGALKQAMARLFPGEEDTARAELRELYRSAEAFQADRSPPPEMRVPLAHADTMRVAAVVLPATDPDGDAEDLPSTTPPAEVTVRVSVADLDTQISSAPRSRAATTQSAPPEAPAAELSAPVPRPGAPSGAPPGTPPVAPPANRTGWLWAAAPLLLALLLGLVAVLRPQTDPPAVLMADAGSSQALVRVPAAPVAPVDAGHDQTGTTDAGVAEPTVALAASADAGVTAVPAAAVDAGVTAAPAATADAGVVSATSLRDGVRVRPRPPRVPAPVSATLPARPRPLGERLRYLSRHCGTRAGTCAADVAARQQRINTLQPAELSALAADVERCLDACGAPR